MKISRVFLFYCLIVFGPQAWSGPITEVVKGYDVVSGKKIEAPRPEIKGIVVVFLSAVCPCSDSHLRELASLSKEYPKYSFVGVHSNTDEEKAFTQKYFKQANLPFPIVQDNGAKIADVFKAYKTPHVFIVRSEGEIVYQGGVTNSHIFENADQKYLRQALEDLEKSNVVRQPEGRTLGCVIDRGGKHAW